MRGLFIVLSAAPFFGIALLRHLVKSDRVMLIICGIGFGPVLLVGFAAMLRSRLRGGTFLDRRQGQPKRNNVPWPMLADQWRQGLMMAMLVVICLATGVLALVCLWLEQKSPAFASLAAYVTPQIGLLIIVAFSTAATFAGAAMLGPKLIRFTTGRMPMGRHRK